MRFKVPNLTSDHILRLIQTGAASVLVALATNMMNTLNELSAQAPAIKLAIEQSAASVERANKLLDQHAGAIIRLDTVQLALADDVNKVKDKLEGTEFRVQQLEIRTQSKGSVK